jgi:hypothetical protein
MIETPEQLAAILKREYEAADSFHEQLEELQRLAFEFYEGQPLRNEIDGRSQIVLPDVQETVDYMLQSVMRTLTSAERVVEFEAVDESDEQAADDATVAIDYEFMRRQDGFRVLLDTCNDGLLRKIGIVKAVMDKRERVTREQQVMLPEELGMLPEGVEVEDVADNGDGSITASLKITRVEQRATGVSVPTFEFRFSPNARHEDSAVYVAHVCPKTRGELVEMGFDREQVYSLPAYNKVDDQDTESATIDFFRYQESSPAVEEVELCEEYARIDVDGDGIAERVKVFRVENTILRYQGAPVIDEMTGGQAVDDRGEPLFEEGELAVETVEEQPFSVFCPFPRPHHLIGYSLADKVMDIQYLRTMLARQMIDGMAFANLPRYEVSETLSGENTLEDILNPIPGSPIRVRSPGAINAIGSNFDVGASLTAMEWAAGERESRTGITRLNQGLDADALNKTASGTAMMQAQGQQIEEFIARNMAEMMSRFFMKLYRLMRSAGEPMKLKVDGKYRMVNPREWPDDICVKVRVGLGTNSKDKRIQARMALYQPMLAAIEQGLAGPEHAFKWMDGIARDTGIGTGDEFMFNPDDPEVQARMMQDEQEPSPDVIEAQGRVEVLREKAAFDAELAAFKAQAQLELEAAKIDGQLDLAAYRAENEARLAAMKARFEARMKVEMSDNREGGSLAE